MWFSTAPIAGRTARLALVGHRQVAAPAELGAQDGVVVVALGVEQACRPGGLAHQHPDLGLRGQIGLAVAGDVDVALVEPGDADLDAAVPGDHQGAVTEGVGADGDQHDHIQGRVDQGAAPGQGIGGGARGGRDDDAVGALGVHEGAVDVGLELDDPGRIPFVDHDIVQGQQGLVVPPLGLCGSGSGSRRRDPLKSRALSRQRASSA